MIGSILCDVGGSLLNCYACQTKAVTLVSIEPISKLALPQLESIHGTRCDACGDVRLYQFLQDGTTDADIRAELDELACYLTEACSEDLSRGRH